MAPCHSTCSGTSASAPSRRRSDRVRAAPTSASAARASKAGRTTCAASARVVGHRRPRLILLGGRLLLRCVAPPWSGTARRSSFIIGSSGTELRSRSRSTPSSSIRRPATTPTTTSLCWSLSSPEAQLAAGGTMVTVRGSLGRGGREAHERRRPARGDVDHAARGRARVADTSAATAWATTPR